MTKERDPRVAISSVTGKPITWRQSGPDRILPDRVSEDAPDPGADESNDDRIARDVPPHWGDGA